ncbi:4-aminobutyrate--2-oxoglutarate transaminase [Streptomyces sp. CMB-StM0423]|uniref:4-aminobutyrate--2-oxoglutarate transaminase n=1 Tax=Streptomyces sp. CMB-StM0423 TaxID=2059884 RepID=UPI000C71497E|nr:4-aminobutyrate--2-oxoglutarate transaminase [Streptomyces sp. CMB-StM0423]AUH40197.1 4-aminobutyrate--2-oxoglutarate transaminase [Streptomyces sp. CMB-StM0423]
MTSASATAGAALPQERRLVTPIPGPKSQELMARKNGAVAQGVGTVMPVFAARAAGGVVEDVDGNRLIDFGAGIAVTSVGNSAEAVVRRASAQLADFTHTCMMVTPYEGYVEVCEQLAELTPGDHAKKSALFNSGAEAVENAVKIARSYTGRQAVVVFDHGYHGRTNLTMALTAKDMPYKHGFGPFAPEIYRVPVAYPYRWLTGPENCAEEAAAQAVDLITKQVGAENVAAIVIEPILGEGGFIVPAPGFLPRIAQFAKDNGIVFVADEIQSGFCRTGQWFASEAEGVVPDLITTAKGIAGGLPLAAVTGRAEMMDAPHVGGLGGTYGGNPVACAAALGAIETMRELDLNARARRIEEIMKSRLIELQGKYDAIGEVRGRGAMLAIELVKPGTKDPDPQLTAALAKACHTEGLLVLTTGTYGNVMRFLPPLVIGEDLLAEGLDILEGALSRNT